MLLQENGLPLLTEKAVVLTKEPLILLDAPFIISPSNAWQSELVSNAAIKAHQRPATWISKEIIVPDSATSFRVVIPKPSIANLFYGQHHFELVLSVFLQIDNTKRFWVGVTDTGKIRTHDTTLIGQLPRRCLICNRLYFSQDLQENHLKNFHHYPQSISWFRRSLYLTASSLTSSIATKIQVEIY